MKTAVEWLIQQLSKEWQFEERDLYLIEKAKEMEKEQSHKYAEFAIRCDRKDMKILYFEDYIKLVTFKSE